MNRVDKVAVCSRSFSTNRYLRERLCDRYLHVKFNDAGEKMQGESLVEFLHGQHKAIVGLERIDADVLSQLPDLKVIAKYGVGLDGIDLAAVRKFRVKLGWKPGVNRRSVAELVLAVAIILLRKANMASIDARAGIWKQQIGSLLTGKTVGVVGRGAVGKDLISLLLPFNCGLIVHDIVDCAEFDDRHQVQRASLISLIRQSDVVTIHLPLDQSTEGMFSMETLQEMKRGAVLINSARGGIVDERALKQLLKSGHIGAAGFDVFRIEPPTDLELLNLPNFFVTPHIGGSAIEAVVAMGEVAIEGLDENTVPTIQT